MPSTKIAINTRATQLYRARKRAVGLCVWGGCLHQATTWYCPEHRIMVNRYAHKNK